jgi:hypothetical protein
MKKPLFVAVGHNGLRIVSEDGVEWKNAQIGKEGEIYRAVCYGDGRYVAVGSSGGDNIFTASTDGVVWQTSKKDAKYSKYARGLLRGERDFLALGGDPGAVGDSRPFLLRSTDGLQWAEPLDIPGKNMLRRMAFGAGLYVAVGDRGRKAVTKDLKDWQDVPDVKAVDTLIDVGFGNGVFVGVGLHGLRMTTKDGLKWSDRQVGEEGEHINSILWTGERFVAVGQGGTYLSPNGYDWTRAPNVDWPLTATYGNGVFVGANWKGRLLCSDDAIMWKQVHKCEFHIEAVAYGA